MPRTPSRQPQDRAGTDIHDMEQGTPAAPLLNPMAGTDARPLRPSDVPSGSAAARRGVVHMLCEGRRRVSGRVQSNAGEHIDLIVPEKADNEAAVEEYLDPVNQVGMTPEQRAQVLAGHNADTIMIAGQHYHFVGGEVTDVLVDHVAWLQSHPVFSFKVVSA